MVGRGPGRSARRWKTLAADLATSAIGNPARRTARGLPALLPHCRNSESGCGEALWAAYGLERCRPAAARTDLQQSDGPARRGRMLARLDEVRLVCLKKRPRLRALCSANWKTTRPRPAVSFNYNLRMGCCASLALLPDGRPADCCGAPGAFRVFDFNGVLGLAGTVGWARTTVLLFHRQAL